MVESILLCNFAINMVRVERYSNQKAEEWNDFVKASKNGTFLFLRAYMDYHSDRFADHSLMFYSEKGRLLAVMPANENGSALCSHQGLTYGGLVMSPGIHAAEVEKVFSATMDYLRERGFTEWIYKQMPYIYSSVPAQEDEYWLWRNGAEILACNLSSTVDYSVWETKSAEYCRRNALNRLRQQDIRLNMNARMSDYWDVLETCLKEKYNAAPVHTLQEMMRLQQLLPENIACCTAESADGEILAGVVLYLKKDVVHVQYSATTATGRQLGAQDFLYLALIKHFADEGNKRFFDLGTSNEEGGKVLNATLNRYKEGFGARGVTYKQWRIRL